MRARRLLYLVVGLALAAAGRARWDDFSVLDDPRFVASLNRGLDQMYGLRLELAQHTFQGLSAARPGHPIGPLLEAEILWWRIQLDPMATDADERLLERIDAALEQAEARMKRDRRDVDARFALATAYALRGRLRSLRRDWVTAAWDGKRALNHVRELHELRPVDPDLNLGLGLYDYLAAKAPERYPVLKALGPFFPDGDRDRGLARLARAKRSGRISRTEAAFFLLQVEYFFEVRFQASLEEVRWLRERHPENSVFHLFEGRIYSRWRQCARAGEIFRQVLERRRAGAPGYGEHQAEVAYFHLGRCALLEDRPGEAHRHADALEELADRRGSTYRSSAHLHRGMALDLEGDRERARTQYRRSLSLPDVGATHERARKFLDRAYEAGNASREETDD